MLEIFSDPTTFIFLSVIILETLTSSKLTFDGFEQVLSET